MTARQPVSINPQGDEPRRVADALRIVDENLLTEYTPTSAADTSAPNIKFAYDASFFYVQLSKGVWRRTAHATW